MPQERKECHGEPYHADVCISAKGEKLNLSPDITLMSKFCLLSPQLLHF